MNNEENKTPFDVTKYPKEKYTNSKGEEKERFIIPDNLFDEHIKELPDGSINESRNKIAHFGGYLKPLGSSEEDREIQKMGGEALQAKLRQRRTLKEELLLALLIKDKQTGKTRQEEITLAQIERALTGDTKSFLAIRDTIGEKPAEALDLNANVITEADQALIDKLKSRTGIE